jgi:hypothetical protein
VVVLVVVFLAVFLAVFVAVLVAVVPWGAPARSGRFAPFLLAFGPAVLPLRAIARSSVPR